MRANTGHVTDNPTNAEMPAETEGMHGDKRYTHPAFGHIHANRVSSSTGVHLLGSDFPHTHFVEITISESELVRSGLSYDRYHSGKQLVSVMVSEAQWATFVSSMNAGGTPCTLHRVMGKTLPDIPERKKLEVAKAEVQAKVDSMLADIERTIKNVNGELGQSLSEKKRTAILEHLQHLRSTVKAGLPWVAEMFAEEMEGTVERAKIEVNAYMTSQVNRAGLAALAAAGGGPFLLDAGEPDGMVMREADSLLKHYGSLDAAIHEARALALDDPNPRTFQNRVVAELKRRQDA